MDLSISKSKDGNLNLYNRAKKKILNIFLDIVFIILFLIAILLLINFISLRSGSKIRPFFGAYVIVSPSMVPTINVNDAVVVKRTDVDKLKKGDIITFSSSDVRYFGYTITHRIVDIENDSSGNVVFRTKGDNNNSIDNAPVLSDNVFGKVLFVVPYLGSIQSFLKKPIGWFLMIIIPSLIFLVMDLFSIFRYKRKLKDGCK